MDRGNIPNSHPKRWRTSRKNPAIRCNTARKPRRRFETNMIMIFLPDQSQSKASTSGIKKVSQGLNQICSDQINLKLFSPAFSIDGRICQSFMHHEYCLSSGDACIFNLKDKRLEASFFCSTSELTQQCCSMHSTGNSGLFVTRITIGLLRIPIASSFIMFHLP